MGLMCLLLQGSHCRRGCAGRKHISPRPWLQRVTQPWTLEPVWWREGMWLGKGNAGRERGQNLGPGRGSRHGAPARREAWLSGMGPGLQQARVACPEGRQWEENPSQKHWREGRNHLHILHDCPALEGTMEPVALQERGRPGSHTCHLVCFRGRGVLVVKRGRLLSRPWPHSTRWAPGREFPKVGVGQPLRCWGGRVCSRRRSGPAPLHPSPSLPPYFPPFLIHIQPLNLPS